MRFRVLFLLALMSLLWVSVLPVEAAPMIRVTPVWRPSSQLTSIDTDADGVTDAGDDIRYVTVDIYATVNVEFWAVGMVCTVNKAVLESYVPFGDPNSAEDNTEVFATGTAWPIDITETWLDTIDADGKVNFGISLVGTGIATIGSNGVEENLYIASLQYRVRENLSAAGSSPLTCTGNFLNRDGRKVLNASFVAPSALRVITGYQFTGSVTYQGISRAPITAQAIQITCDDADVDTVFDDVVTTANITTGAFIVNNLRTQGRYDCLFNPNLLGVSTADPIHLSGSTDFYLNTSSFAMLPINLRNGNIDTSAFTELSITPEDLIMVTSNWNAPSSLLTQPYMWGDANGDRKINEMDLALVGGNFLRSSPFSSQHILYSIAQDNSASFNNHLWLGEVNDSVVRPFGSGTSRDYWPAVSPDGRRIAFVRNLGTSGQDQFALFVAPITNGIMGTPVRISSVTASYDAFAPSWSPDASQLAFVCSYNDAWMDLINPFGYLCTVDASGQNFRLLATTNNFNFRSKLQTAAWFNNDNILFAYAANPTSASSCDTRICMVELPTNSFWLIGLVANTDMPYIRNTPMGVTLFYRYNDGMGNRNIRFAMLDSFATPLAAYPNTNPASLHENIETGVFPGGSIISTNVGYYTVSTGADPDILFYEGTTGGSSMHIRFFTGTGSAPNWDISTYYFYPISDGISNPAATSGYNAAIPNTAVYLP